jgi:nickel-dependent lactate racemase
VIPEKAEVTILNPAKMQVLSLVEDVLNHSLTHPVGCKKFENLVQSIRPLKVAIAIPDETRPTPVKEILTILLKRLYVASPQIKPERVTIIIGGGLHPHGEKMDMKQLAAAYNAEGCRIVSHDAVHDRMINFGVTSRGTPVLINAEFAETDLKIVIGQIDPHQFVGFTGGAKGVVIGCAAAESIKHNHGLMFEEGAQVGILERNPVREDLNEAGELVGIHLAVNVVLDADNKVVQVLAGTPLAVLKEGARMCAQIFGVSIDKKFDIAIASCGGYPKDISLYQAQKGLNLASQAVKLGGRILLLAACPIGVGDDVYFDYVSRFATPKEAMEDFKKIGFKMGAHKAYLFGRTLINYDVVVFSDLDSGILKQCHLKAADPSEVIRKWVEDFDGRPSIAVIPNANTTYFHQKLK